MSPELQVDESGVPILMIHGDQDTLVSLHHSEKLKVQLDAKSVPNQLLVIENAGHAFIGDDKKRAEQAMVAWFNKRLRGL